MKRLLGNYVFTDVTQKLDDSDLEQMAHRCILASYSKALRAAFRGSVGVCHTFLVLSFNNW